jgi:hypothetical protein
MINLWSQGCIHNNQKWIRLGSPNFFRMVPLRNVAAKTRPIVSFVP